MSNLTPIFCLQNGSGEWYRTTTGVTKVKVLSEKKVMFDGEYYTLVEVTNDFGAQSIWLAKELSQKVELNRDYTAEVSSNGVVVGCQTFTFESIENLHKAVQKIRGAKSSRVGQTVPFNEVKVGERFHFQNYPLYKYTRVEPTSSTKEDTLIYDIEGRRCSQSSTSTTLCVIID